MALTAVSWPAAAVHDLTVVADGWVLVVRCSCSWSMECDDDEVPLGDLVRYAEDHRHAYDTQAELLEHHAAGHVTRLTREEGGGGMVVRCSCGRAWPVEATG